jgi:hypothetical protein
MPGPPAGGELGTPIAAPPEGAEVGIEGGGGGGGAPGAGAGAGAGASGAAAPLTSIFTAGASSVVPLSELASFFLQAAETEKTKPTITNRKSSFLNMGFSFLKDPLNSLTWGFKDVEF